MTNTDKAQEAARSLEIADLRADLIARLETAHVAMLRAVAGIMGAANE